MTDSLAAKGTPVIVTGKIQRDYRYRRTEPPGKNFALDFFPEPTPKQTLAPGAF